MSARWERVSAEERGRRYVDHVAGSFRVAQGYDEQARREGRPYVLLEAGRYVGAFAGIREARTAAEERERRRGSGGIPARRRRAA